MFRSPRPNRNRARGSRIMVRSTPRKSCALASLSILMLITVECVAHSREFSLPVSVAAEQFALSNYYIHQGMLDDVGQAERQHAFTVDAVRSAGPEGIHA